MSYKRSRNWQATVFADALIATADKCIQTSFPGQPPAVVAACAIAITRSICQQFARTSMYVPSRFDDATGARDASIVAAWKAPADGLTRPFTNGRLIQIAAQHLMTDRHIRHILKACLADTANLAPADQPDRTLNEQTNSTAKAGASNQQGD